MRTKSLILSLYRIIRVSENPYSCIFCVVLRSVFHSKRLAIAHYFQKAIISCIFDRGLKNIFFKFHVLIPFFTLMDVLLAIFACCSNENENDKISVKRCRLILFLLLFCHISISIYVFERILHRLSKKWLI